jgi:hypothetical protein
VIDLATLGGHSRRAVCQNELGIGTVCGRLMRDYIAFIILMVLGVAGAALYLLDEPISLLPRRVGYAVLGLILLAVIVYLLWR